MCSMLQNMSSSDMGQIISSKNCLHRPRFLITCHHYDSASQPVATILSLQLKDANVLGLAMRMRNMRNMWIMRIYAEYADAD